MSEKLSKYLPNLVGAEIDVNNSILYDGQLVANPVKNITTSYTLTASDNTVFANAAGGGVTVTLPDATQFTGRSFTIKKTDSSVNLITLATVSSQTIDGSTTQTIGAQNASLTLVSDGANWQAVSIDEVTLSGNIVGPLIVKANSATAFMVGANGATNPALIVATNNGGAVVGLVITSNAAGFGVTLSVTGGNGNENLLINAKGNGIIQIGAATTIFITNAQAFTVGLAGQTNPAFQVNTNTANSVTGLNITSNISGAGVLLSVISSSSAEVFTIQGLGTGNVQVNTAALLVMPVGGVWSGGVTAKIMYGDSNHYFQAVQGGSTTWNTIDNLIIQATGGGNTQNITINPGTTGTANTILNRSIKKQIIIAQTLTALGTVQNSTPTAAQLLGGIVTQTGATGAGTVTLDNGTNISAAVPSVAVGDSFTCVFANLGGGFNLTITSATGATVVGNGVVPSGKNAVLTFINTGSNAWNVYCQVSA